MPAVFKGMVGIGYKACPAARCTLHAGLQPALANEGGGTFGLKGFFLHQLFIRILGRFMDKFIHPNTPTTAENPFEIPYPLAIRA